MVEILTRDNPEEHDYTMNLDVDDSVWIRVGEATVYIRRIESREEGDVIIVELAPDGDPDNVIDSCSVTDAQLDHAQEERPLDGD